MEAQQGVGNLEQVAKSLAQSDHHCPQLERLVGMNDLPRCLGNYEN